VQPLRLLLAAAGLLLLAGCQGQLTRSAPAEAATAPAAAPAERPLPFAQPEGGPRELDGDIVYSYLVGEIGAQRGDLSTAYAHYLHAAIIARDAHAAERATRIALFRGHLDDALRATRRWVELAPNDPSARQIAMVLFLREGLADEALAQAEALLSIAAATGSEGFLQIASVLAKESDRAAALQLTRGLVAMHPDDAAAHFALALVEAAADNAAGAEASAREALRLRPDWDQPRVLLSRVLIAEGRSAEALEVLAEGTRRYPEDDVVRTAYARLLIDADELGQAMAQFQRLHEQAPEDADVLFAIGMLGIQTERWDEARSALQALRNLGSRYDEATYYLGQVEEETGRTATAMGLYKAVQKGPLKTDAALRLAALKAEAGAMAEAREILQQVRVLDADRAIDAYLTETRLLQEHGDTEAALAVYETALAANPDDADLLYSRALYAAELERVDWVERDLGRVLELDPDNADALNALGYSLTELTDRYPEAYGYILQAFKLKPENAAILDSLGWVYYRLGQHEQALRYLTLALEKSSDPEIAAHLGEVLWVTGDRSAARRVWKDALKDAPEHPILRATVERFQ
jgi:tetratricopeptide (TPR) repeat protein